MQLVGFKHEISSYELLFTTIDLLKLYYDLIYLGLVWSFRLFVYSYFLIVEYANYVIDFFFFHFLKKLKNFKLNNYVEFSKRF